MLKGKDLLSHKIEAYIEDLLKDGTLKEGDRLLPEREIARLFKASNRPVRAAMQRFIDRGILERVQGKGTFVRHPMGETGTDRIGVVHCHSRAGFFNSPFYSAIIAGIEEQSQVARKSLLVRSLVGEGEEAPGPVFREIASDVDGMLVIGLTMLRYRELKPVVEKSSVPVVVLNLEESALHADRVVTDSRENTRMLVKHLIDSGHRNIACLYKTVREETVMHPNSRHRIESYRMTMAQAGLPVNESWIVDTGRPESLQALEECLGSNDRPTGLYCAAGHIVPSVIYPILGRLSMTVPEDISIVAYDDDRRPGSGVMPYTTADTSLNDMGRLGVLRLLEKRRELAEGIKRHYEITVPGRIVLRQSVKVINT